MFFTPCPISGFLAMIVTIPSGVIRMNALGTKSAAGVAHAVAASAVSMYVARSIPPPTMDETRRKLRRLTFDVVVTGSPYAFRTAGVLRPPAPVPDAAGERERSRLEP